MTIKNVYGHGTVILSDDLVDIPNSSLTAGSFMFLTGHAKGICRAIKTNRDTGALSIEDPPRFICPGDQFLMSTLDRDYE